MNKARFSMIALVVLFLMPMSSILAKADIVSEGEITDNDNVENNSETTFDVYNESGADALRGSETQNRISGSTISDVQVGELDANTKHLGSSAIYIYIFSDESLDIEIARDAMVTSASGELHLMDMDGIVVSKGVFDGTISTPIKLSIAAKDSKTGLYALVYKDTSGYGSSGTGSKLTFQIKNSIGELQKGRVFSKRWELEQSGRLIDYTDNRKFQDSSDFELYHRTTDGYLYKQEMTGYNGIISTISSDGIGIVNNATCAPILGDARYYNAKYPALIFDSEIQNTCNLELESNSIFIDMPDPKLPAEAKTPFGEIISVNPKLEDRPQEISNVSYNKTSPYTQGGTFEFVSKNIQSFLDVTIHTSESGLFDDVKSIKKSAWTSESQNSVSLAWDGKYEDGTDVPNYATIRVDVELKKAGEIHFVLSDVEMRHSLTVTRLNGYNSKDVNRLYYDSSSIYYPIDKTISTGFFGGFSDELSSYDSLLNPKQHSWDYETPANIGSTDNKGTWSPLRLDSDLINYQTSTEFGYYYGQQDFSLGDGSYIQDWTYENVSLKKTTEFEPQHSNLNLSIEGKTSNPNGLVEKGDSVDYKIVIENSGNGFASKVKIKDTLEDILNYIESPLQNNVTISYDGVVMEYTIADLINGIEIPLIDAGKSVEISFNLKVKKQLPSNLNKTKFINKVSAIATCSSTDKVNSCSQLDALSTLTIRVPGNPIIDIDDNNSINGGFGPGDANVGQGNINYSKVPGWLWMNGNWQFVGINVLTGVYQYNYTQTIILSFALVCVLLLKGYRNANI